MRAFGLAMAMVTAALVAGCGDDDDTEPRPDASVVDAGVDASVKSDAGTHCEYNGKTYAVGDAVIKAGNDSCTCLASGDVGLCTRNFPDPADGCTYKGQWYGVGAVVPKGALSCICRDDGTLGQCTGANLDDAGDMDDAGSSDGGTE